MSAFISNAFYRLPLKANDHLQLFRKIQVGLSSVTHETMNVIKAKHASKVRNISFDEAKRRIRHAVPPLGKELIDGGLVEAMEDESTYEHFDWFMPLKKKLGNDRRGIHEVSLSFNLISKMREMVYTNCDRCLYLQDRCICKYLSESNITPHNNLWVMQTTGEYGRNNNSGSILCVAAGARRVLRGWKEQEDQLLKTIEDRPTGSVIALFPTDNAVTLDEYIEQRRLLDKENEMEIKSDFVDIVLLDGTPGEASNMERFLPTSVPRVSLNRVQRKSWLNPIREQSGPERVCTAQAAAAVLEELGDGDMAREIERLVKLALKINQDNRARCKPRDTRVVEN